MIKSIKKIFIGKKKFLFPEHWFIHVKYIIKRVFNPPTLRLVVLPIVHGIRLSGISRMLWFLIGVYPRLMSYHVALCQETRDGGACTHSPFINMHSRTHLISSINLYLAHDKKAHHVFIGDRIHIWQKFKGSKKLNKLKRNNKRNE